MDKQEYLSMRISRQTKAEFLEKIKSYNPNLKLAEVLTIMIKAFNKEGWTSIYQKYGKTNARPNINPRPNSARK